MRVHVRWILAMAVLVGPALDSAAQAQPLDVLIQWNRILQTTVASTATPTVFFTRPYSMTGIAVFDALNSIDHVYQPYLIELSTAPGASREGAIAQAAHDVLAALYNGFRELADEQAKSRVYRGIHFWFDQEASFGECIRMADYAFDNLIRRR